MTSFSFKYPAPANQRRSKHNSADSLPCLKLQQFFTKIQLFSHPKKRKAGRRSKVIPRFGEVIRIAQGYGLDEEKTAAHFQRPLVWVKSAFLSAEAYADEIQTAIRDAQANHETGLARLLPQLEIRQ